MPATGMLLSQHLLHPCPERVRRNVTLPARTSDRRKGYRGDQFRVVIQAMALIGVRPAVIEHIFAPGMAARIERHPAAPDLQVAGLPAGFRGNGTTALQGIEKSVAEERIYRHSLSE